MMMMLQITIHPSLKKGVMLKSKCTTAMRQTCATKWCKIAHWQARTMLNDQYKTFKYTLLSNCLVPDSNTCLTSEEFCHKVQHITSSAYHKQSNGSAEVY